jgi:hypothetical protein
MMLPGKSELAQLGQKIQTRRFLYEVGRVQNLHPVDTESGRRDVAIGFLTCSLHLPLMLLAAKSFYHFSGIICPLYVWDDGSLTSRDRDEVRKLFPYARILRRSDFDFGQLARYPLISAFAQQRLEKYESYAPALKLIGPLASPSAPERFILSDSDAFFFDWPQAIADWLDSYAKTNRYIEPWSGHDNVAEEDLQDLYAKINVSSCPRINSGLLLIHRSIFKLDILEEILKFYRGRPYAWDIEQTIYRILMSCSASEPLSQDDYVLCHRKYNAVCHHFFTSVIFEEAPVREKIVNLLGYIRDCEQRAKPPVSVVQEWSNGRRAHR